MEAQEPRADLAALASRLARRLGAAELPLLAEAGLTMWEYIALGRLARGASATQVELARAIRYDKTRLIALLDGLEAKGMVTRAPDPVDRRARIVQATALGLRRHTRAQTLIRRMEAEMLGELGTREQQRFIDSLARLADRSR